MRYLINSEHLHTGFFACKNTNFLNINIENLKNKI